MIELDYVTLAGVLAACFALGFMAGHVVGRS
jgi:hypothetical protein